MDTNKIAYYEELLESDIVNSIQTLLELIGNGDMDAAYVLGMEYYEGDHIRADKEKSIHYLSLAYKAGHIRATHDLGCFKYYGYGFPKGFKDINKARSIISESANKGYQPSIQFLESMY